ncbi:MAG: isopentenyl-diphosphate Delta-isomerase [Candidatus Saccharibacteria bacterium]
MKAPKEQVVLVDAQNRELGLADKATVHTNDTPLHRGFSLFIFNSRGQLLLQQRAMSKKTWPGVWSNSVCGHPAKAETAQAAAVRRANYELGIALNSKDIIVFEPSYMYRYEHKGVVEHEFCPVFVVQTDAKPKANADEVAATRWVDWADFVAEVKQPNAYSEWCVEETGLLEKNPAFRQFYKGLRT